MEEEEDLSPFWLPPTSTSSNRRPHRRSSPIFLSTGFLLILLLATSLALIFIVVPAFTSFTSNIFRPHLVKKSWDSLNLVLVLFAIICGFLSRNTSNNEDTPRANLSSNTRSQWYVSGDEYSDQTVYRAFKNSSFGRLRSSSSYPDLRVESQWPTYTYHDERLRFYDDTRLHGYSSFEPGSGSVVVDQVVKLGDKREEDEKFETKSTIVEQVMVKEKVEPPPLEADSESSPPADHVVSRRKASGKYEDILKKPDEEILGPPHMGVQMDTTEESGDFRREPVRTYQAVRRRPKSESEIFLPPETLLPPAPAEEPVLSTRKPARTYGAVPRKPRSDLETLQQASPPPYVEAPPPSRSEHRRRMKRTYEAVVENPRWESQVPEPVVTPPPPPPPPMETYYRNWEEKSEKQEKKRSGSATKEFLNSLRRRKKKQRQKSIESFESLLVAQPPASSSSRFLYPLPYPPPPPPPPPPFRLHSIFSSRKGKNKKSQSNSPPPPPPPPPKNSISIKMSTLPSKPRISDTIINTGGQSPLIPIPPPPPPPPFKMPEWRYKVRGDFVRINSITSSRSSSPDIEEEDNDDDSRSLSMKESCPPSPVVEPNTPISCPSPDVNTKADSFIAKFRAGLKLEKMNSMKQRRPGRSNLGLGPYQEPHPESPNLD